MRRLRIRLLQVLLLVLVVGPILAAVGPQSTQVLMLKFPDAPFDTEPCTPAYYADVIFNQFNAWMSTESHGVETYPGSIANVWGWYTMPHPASYYCTIVGTPPNTGLQACSSFLMLADARTIGNQHFVWDNQDLIALVFSKIDNAAGISAGIFKTTCNASSTLLNFHLYTAVHEGGGHANGLVSGGAAGLAHAKQTYCPNGVDVPELYDYTNWFTGPCTTLQYGNILDPLGASIYWDATEWAKNHFSMPYQVLLGWKQPSNTQTLTFGSQSVRAFSVTLTDMRLATSSVQQVRIPLPNVGDGWSYAYSLEYRPDVGVLINFAADDVAGGAGHDVRTVNGQTWPPIITATNPFLDPYRSIGVQLVSSNSTTANIIVTMPADCDVPGCHGCGQ